MFFPNVPGATFIPGAMSIPESRVLNKKARFMYKNEKKKISRL